MSLSENKKQLRQAMRQAKHNYTTDELMRKSVAVVAQLQEQPLFRAAQTVMLYYSLPDEVNTHALVMQLVQSKRVILPTIVGQDIVPVEFTGKEQLVEGDFHIAEPRNAAYTGTFDLIVVPGMAFDASGHRLGRGKGFYDRFLAKHPNVPTIGLCFDFQLVKEVPAEPFDKPVDYVVCEK